MDSVNAELQQYDPLILWQSVDENAADPLANDDVIALLKQVQNHARVQTGVDLFISHIIDNALHSDWTDVDELARNFLTWREDFAPNDRTTVQGFKNKLARVSHDYQSDDVTIDHRISPDPTSRRSQYLFNYSDEDKAAQAENNRYAIKQAEGIKDKFRVVK